MSNNSPCSRRNRRVPMNLVPRKYRLPWPAFSDDCFQPHVHFWCVSNFTIVDGDEGESKVLYLNSHPTATGLLTSRLSSSQLSARQKIRAPRR